MFDVFLKITNVLILMRKFISVRGIFSIPDALNFLKTIDVYLIVMKKFSATDWDENNMEENKMRMNIFPTYVYST